MKKIIIKNNANHHCLVINHDKRTNNKHKNKGSENFRKLWYV